MGKGHPPEDSQFKSGEDWNGNASGRPKGSLSLTSILRNVLNEKSADKASKLSKAQEIIAVMIKNALAGDTRMIDMIMTRIDGKVPDILVGGLGFGALEEVPEAQLDQIIAAGQKAKEAMSGK